MDAALAALKNSAPRVTYSVKRKVGYDTESSEGSDVPDLKRIHLSDNEAENRMDVEKVD